MSKYVLTTSGDPAFPLAYGSTCRHCGRDIVKHSLDGWVDPEATGDDSIWRETCDSNDTERAAPHEPARTCTDCGRYEDRSDGMFVPDLPDMCPACDGLLA